MPGLSYGVRAWQDGLRRIEGAGYSAVAISDHVIGGWSMDPPSMLAAAAVATTTLRLRTLVLSNDLRHPALVHRAIATIDVLSDGRVELGIGAGWWREEYATLGLTFDAPEVRIERLDEAIRLIKALFDPEPVTFLGRHYRVTDLTGLPQPVQRPRPPILIGGGGRRVLELAGREADIVAINPVLRTGRPTDSGSIPQADPGRLAELLAGVRTAASSAGRDPGALRYQVSLLAWDVRTMDGRRRAGRSSLAPDAWTDLEGLRGTPGVLVGEIGECAEQVAGWRGAYGISDVHLGSIDGPFAELVARMAGT
jgi:probable F420-dependent oxidoreductase